MASPSRPDPRTAGQLSIPAGPPSAAVTTLVAFNVIHPTLPVVLLFAAGLLILVRLGWRFASALFDRERLITNSK